MKNLIKTSARTVIARSVTTKQSHKSLTLLKARLPRCFQKARPREAYLCEKAPRNDRNDAFLDVVQKSFRLVLCVFLLSILLPSVVNAAEQYSAGEIYERGRVHHENKDYKEALEQYEISLELFRKVGDKRAVHPVMNSIGKVYYSSDRYSEALKYFNNALIIAKQLNSQTHIPPYLNDISEVYYSLGKYDEALKYLEEAVRIESGFKRARVGFLAGYLNNIGKVYYSWGWYDKALEYFDEALTINKKEHVDAKKADNLNNIGKVHYSNGMYEEALRYFDEALIINKKVRADAKRADNLNNIGKVYYSNGMYEEALEYIENALEINTELKKETKRADNLNDIGVVYFFLQEYDKAIKQFYEALEIDRARKREAETAIRLSNIGFSSYKLKDYSSAILRLSESVRIYEKIRKTAKGDIRRDYLTKVIGTYKLLSAAYISNGEIERAFEVIELSRAKLLAERIAGSDDMAGLFSVKDAKEEIKKESAVIIYANSDLEEMIQIALTDDSISGHKILSDALPKDAMKKYEGSAEVLTTGKRGIIIAKKNASELKSTLAANKAVETSLGKLIDYYIALLINPSPDNDKIAKSLGRVFYDHLIKPMEADISGKKRLIIVPDGLLGLIPFETLVDENGGYLGETYNITYTQSLGILRLLGKRKYRPDRKPLLAFGGAVYDDTSYDVDMISNEAQLKYLEKSVHSAFEKRGSVRDAYASLGFGNWKNLMGTLNEVKAIAKNADGAKLLTRDDVREEIIKSMSSTGMLSDYKVIHFATHGLTVSELPELSALVLSQFEKEREDDGYLRMGEVSELDLKADFVNLSACETGLGKIYGGEGVVGLSQSFLIAGANGLSVSLWSVLDDSTTKFMVTMYRLVDEKKISYAKAITETKRRFINGDFGDKYKAPFYWAPFVYYGM